MKPRALLIFLFSLVVIVAGLPACQPLQELDKAPAISLQLIDGRKISLQQLQGRPVLITFWATTCASCRKEMPHLIALYNELAPKGLEIIGVAMSYDPPNQVVALSKRLQIPYPLALDVEGNIALAFGDVNLTPTSFLIGPDGSIVQHDVGIMDMNGLRKRIEGLL